jgi:hypothetical protein
MSVSLDSVIVRRSLVASASVLLAFFVSACAADADHRRGSAPEDLGEVSAELTAECTANVKGEGMLDVETTYLPDVVHCENGGAPLESLKAQAIAARTYLYYKLQTSSSISDGQGDQVYTCGSHATALEKQAVADTAGEVLQYGTTTIAAFFVAGGEASPPACKDSASSTSGDVTYNEGLSGASIHQTPLGFVSPSNKENRGCLSQLGSRCLADEGKKADEILKFYYGADIAIVRATGPCVPMLADAGPTADGGATRSDSGATETEGGAANMRSGVADASAGQMDGTGDDSGGCNVARVHARNEEKGDRDLLRGGGGGLLLLGLCLLRRRRRGGRSRSRGGRGLGDLDRRFLGSGGR